jgi:myo-inositol-1(or 4)-monophosphatase
MTPEALLPVALDAVTMAGELIRDRLPGHVIAKGDRDMVTDLDFAVERAVRARLRDRTPDIAVLGEEEGVTGDADGELLWALDPVDGTANLVHGIPLTGVSLGLLRGGRPVVGVIDLPFLGTRYSAVEHGGAYAGDRRLATSRTSRLRDAVVAVGDYAVGAGAEEKNLLRLALSARLAGRVQRVRMLGSVAVDLAWLADGRLDASMTLSNQPWDTAAGVIIAREAGAVVIDLDGSDHTLASTATIAVAPGLAEELLALAAWTHEEVAS